jgi:hypothetical protein
MNLQEIKEREAKATPGFWVNMGEHNPDSIYFGEIRCGGTQEQEAFTLIAVMPELDDRTDDFNFIAHAREDIPALVAEVERLHTEIDQVLDYYSTQVERLQAKLETEVNYRDMRIGDFEKEIEQLQAENKRLKESLADSLCNCGYILPSRIALDPANHSVNCAYTRAMEAIP